jgi:hypothetical protein
VPAPLPLPNRLYTVTDTDAPVTEPVYFRESRWSMVAHALFVLGVLGSLVLAVMAPGPLALFPAGLGVIANLHLVDKPSPYTVPVSPPARTVARPASIAPTSTTIPAQRAISVLSQTPASPEPVVIPRSRRASDTARAAHRVGTPRHRRAPQTAEQAAWSLAA